MSDLGAGRRASVIGTGLIGGSIGLALRGRGFHRVGYDSDAATLARAREMGAIDEAAESLESSCAQADLAVLATPVVELLQHHAQRPANP